MKSLSPNTQPITAVPADDGDPLDWVLIDACPTCGEMFGHVVGCPELDRPR